MLGLKLGLNLGSFLSAAQNPLRIAAMQDFGHTGKANRSSLTHAVIRWPYVLAGDHRTLAVALNTFYRGISSEVGLGNALNVIDMAIETPNGTICPVYFSGSRSVTLSSDETLVESEEITAAQFGYSVLTDQMVICLKAHLSVDTAGHNMPYSSRNTFSDSNLYSQVSWFDDSATTITDTDVAGKYTVVSGTAFNNYQYGFNPVLIGRPVVDRPSFLTNGDSIAERKNDNIANIYTRGGIFNNAMCQPDFTQGHAHINFALSSSKYAAAGGYRWAEYCKYVRFGIDEYGTNDMTVASLAGLKTAGLNIWNKMREKGCEAVIRTKFLPLTNSTDNWTTAGNQTKTTEFQTGGKADLLNDFYETSLTSGDIDYLVDFNDLRDPSDFWLWGTDGVTAQLMASDSTHPSPNGCQVGAAELRLLIDALE